jgi:hypothetical protein
MATWLSKSDAKAVGAIATIAIVLAGVWKLFSKDQKCPTCDRVIAAGRILGAVCPQCAVGRIKV